MWWKLIFGAVWASTIFSPIDSQSMNTRRISTSLGPIDGILVQAAGMRTAAPVLQMLNVPYARAPVNRYRFRMPINVNKWSGRPMKSHDLMIIGTDPTRDINQCEGRVSLSHTVKPHKDPSFPTKTWLSANTQDATNSGSVCVQRHATLNRDAQNNMPALKYERIVRLRQDYLDNRESEDCLTMNIFVPNGGSSNVGLRTLVIVHGDDYDWNSANAYNGSTLAAYGSIIVVTVNYRLGAFGFLGSCQSTCNPPSPQCSPICEGNWGLWDLTVGMTFLRDILPGLGGDPQGVTMMGWGSGAALVNLFMASPGSGPDGRLLKRAILLGGSALCPWALVANPQSAFYLLAEELQCQKKGTNMAANQQGYHVDVVNERIMDCLRNESAARVSAAAMKITAPTFMSAFGPIVDGTVVANYPRKNLAEYGDMFQEIDLMIGLTSNEAYDLLSQRDIESGMDVGKAGRMYRTLVRNLFEYHRREIYDAIVNEYTDWENPNGGPKQIRDAVMAALGDALYNAPSIQTAQLHASRQPASRRNIAGTYVYVFAHETRNWERGGSRNDRDSVKGAVRGEDLPYILGYPLWDDPQALVRSPYRRFDQDDDRISRALMRYISNFVKSGDPMQPEPMMGDQRLMETFRNLHWSRFSAAAKEPYLEILSGTAPRSYYGVVRSEDAFSNYPFPPPPLPPTPPPKQPDVETTKKASEPLPASGKVAPVTVEAESDYSTLLLVTVAVGCALLVLNILIFAGMYHQRDKQKRASKKMQLHYHSYQGLGYGPPGGAAAGGVTSPMSATGPGATLQAVPPPSGHQHQHTAGSLPRYVGSGGQAQPAGTWSSGAGATGMSGAVGTAPSLAGADASAELRFSTLGGRPSEHGTATSAAGGTAPRVYGGHSHAHAHHVLAQQPHQGNGTAPRAVNAYEQEPLLSNPSANAALGGGGSNDAPGVSSASAANLAGASSASTLAAAGGGPQPPARPHHRNITGISPTCPRHGRAAQLAAQAAAVAQQQQAAQQQQQQQQQGGGLQAHPPQGVEEIQV